MNEGEERYRGKLVALIVLAREFEQLGFAKTANNWLGMSTYAMLVQTSRLAAAILKLSEEHSFEAQILLRAMFEIWANAVWIRLDQPALRAERFLTWDAIEGARLLDQYPSEEGDEEWEARIKQAKEDEIEARPLFMIRGRGGDRRLSSTWAISDASGKTRQRPSVKDRMDDIEAAREAGKLSRQANFYFTYRLLSQAPHGTAIGLRALVDETDSRIFPVRNPAPPLVVLAGASMHLMSLLLYSDVDVSGDFHNEVEAAAESLREENHRPDSGGSDPLDGDLP